MGISIPGEVVFNPNSIEYFVRTDKLSQLFTFVRPVQTCGNQDKYILAINPRLNQSLHKRRKNQPVWYRTGNIADQDAGAFLSPGEFRQSRALDRINKSITNGTIAVGQNRHGMLINHLYIDMLR